MQKFIEGVFHRMLKKLYAAKARLSKKKGFTLIELLVVIAIIAILVAIIVPTVQSATKKAQGATDAANLRSVQAEAAIAYANGKTGGDLLGAVPDLTTPSKMFSNATIKIAVKDDKVLAYYYVSDVSDVSGGKYYGVDYFAAIANSGSVSSNPTTPPSSSDIVTSSAASSGK